MKVKIGLSFLLTITLTVYSFGQNPFWVHLDKKIIRPISLLDKTKPTEVENHFLKERKSKETKQKLGFGWSKWTADIFGGYTSIKCTFFYYKDTIVSYRLTSRLPDNKELTSKYTEWFGETFTIDSSRHVTFDFQRDNLTKPLTLYDGNLTPEKVSPKILSYMSPHSGLTYGYKGGINNALLENRKNFNDIMDDITNDEIYLIMFSVNTASRLTAIEYYKRNSGKFENKEKIEAWINVVYKEIPFVHTIIGCLGETWESKKLVEFCLEIKE